MRKILLIILLGLLGLSISFAQTKLVAFRSHSGSGPTDFNTSDNFGLPSPKEIYVEDTITQERLWVLITDWGRDSITANRNGYRLLPDSGVPRPHWDSVPWIQPPERRRKMQIESEDIRLH